jgi:hypothetical protein
LIIWSLSIEEIDTDKVALKSRIEASLQRLENQLLIVRNGDEYVFLTNEEKEVEQEIKHTQVEATEENRNWPGWCLKRLWAIAVSIATQ